MNRTHKILRRLSVLLLLIFVLPWITAGCSPAEKDLGLSQAEQAYNKGNYTEAMSLVEQVLKKNPDALPALQLKTQAMVSLNRIADALDHQTRIEKKYPKLAAPLLQEIIISIIKTSLKNENYFVRSAAVKALGEMGDVNFLPLIIPSMRDKEIFVRFFTVESFGQLEGPDFLKLVMASGQDPSSMVRVAAVKVLAQLEKTHTGVETNTLLAIFAKDSDPTVRLLALAAMSKNGDEAAFIKIVSEIKKLPQGAQVSAVSALGRSKNETAIPLIKAYSTHKDHMIRMYAREAMGLIASDAFHPELLKGLEDTDSAVRGASATSLGKLGNPQAIPLLEKYLQDESPMVRLSAAEGLKRLGQNHPTYYEKALNHPDYGVRHFAVSSLRRTWGKEGLPLLRLALKDKAPRVRTAAVRAIGEMGGAESLELLKNSMKDPDLAVRTYAAGNTGRLINKIAGLPLKNLKSD